MIRKIFKSEKQSFKKEGVINSVKFEDKFTGNQSQKKSTRIYYFISDKCKKIDEDN